MLICRATNNAATGARVIEMDFPLRSLTPCDEEGLPAQLATAFEIEANQIVSIHRTQSTDVLVHVQSAIFSTIRPNFQLIAMIQAR